MTAHISEIIIVTQHLALNNFIMYVRFKKFLNFDVFTIKSEFNAVIFY